MEAETYTVNYDDEQEIDLKILLYKAFKEWRRALAIGIILAVLLGAYSLIGSFKVVNDSEAYDSALRSYEFEHAGWESEEVVYNNQIESLNTSKSQQETYNEKSLLMQIDPLNKYTGTYTFYVDSGYTVDPNATVQPIDYTDRILAAYVQYFNGEMMQDLLDSTNLTDEKRFLTEVVSIKSDITSSSLNVTVVGKSNSDVAVLASMIENKLMAHKSMVEELVSTHQINKINGIVSVGVDQGLQTTQMNKKAAIDQYNVSIAETNEKLTEWKESKEPRFEYTPKRIFINCVKMMIIGGVVGVFLTLAWYGIKYVVTGFFTAEKITSCGGKNILAVVSNASFAEVEGTKKKKAVKENGIDRWIRKIFGQEKSTLGFEESCKLAGSNIQGLMETEGINELAVVSCTDAALAKQIETYLDGKCRVKFLGNILADPVAVDGLSAYDAACILAREGQDKIEDVARQYECLRMWSKKIAGTVVISE